MEVDRGPQAYVDPGAPAAAEPRPDRLPQDLAHRRQIATEAILDKRPHGRNELDVAKDVRGHRLRLAIPRVDLTQTET